MLFVNAKNRISNSNGEANILQALRRAVPIGVIPVGLKNTFGKILFGSDKEEIRYNKRMKCEPHSEKVNSMQRSGTEAIRTQIPALKTKTGNS